jgi:TonB family protein
MRILSPVSSLVLVLAASAAGAQPTPPRLAAASLEAAPWNVQGGGIAAYDVTLDERGSVRGADLVQDVPPYGAMLGASLRSWSFEPAREGGRAVPSRILVLGFFRPPMLSFPAPDKPRYKSAAAPEELPWPASVAVPPYPPNALGSGKVIVEADVSDAGAVIATRIVSSPGAFDGAAEGAARQWSYRPARRNGREVASRVVLVFSFIGTTP